MRDPNVIPLPAPGSALSKVILRPPSGPSTQTAKLVTHTPTEAGLDKVDHYMLQWYNDHYDIEYTYTQQGRVTSW